MLVVDDEPFNRMLLSATLEELGHDAETASNGTEALEMLRAGTFDLVFLDLVMPELDGFEVLERMKRSPELQDIPVLVISSVEETESVTRCIELGATDYLPKPCDPVLLRARINGSLAAKRLNDMKASYVREIELLAEELKVRNRFIEETFGRYLSNEVVSQLLSSPDGLKLGGEKRKVTMLMADLRGFSAIAERLSPEQVVRVVNNFLGTMTEVVLSQDGTIDEFIGDSILSFFGAPVEREDDARRAVECALRMQRAMAQVNRANLEDRLPAVEMGMAIHSGEVVVGNIGCFKRAKYGAVGTQINLLGRIEGCTVGGQILVSEATLLESGPGTLLGDSMMVRAKGFPEPVRVFEVVGLSGRPELSLERPEEACVPLKHPIPVLLTLLEGKQVGPVRQGAEITALSQRSAELRTAVPLEVLSNVKLNVLGADGLEVPCDVYAKARPAPSGSPTVGRVRFTSVPPEVGRLFAELLRQLGS
jgi:class 3 adenylate cyclase/CheY-like chemotaxis protein